MTAILYKKKLFFFNQRTRGLHANNLRIYHQILTPVPPVPAYFFNDSVKNLCSQRISEN